MPFATRTYADLRKGKWKGKDVTVKLLRFSVNDDRVKITKVPSPQRDGFTLSRC